LGVEHIKLDHT